MTKYKVNVGAGVWCFVMAYVASEIDSIPLMWYCIVVATLNIAYGTFRLVQNYLYQKRIKQFREARRMRWERWEREHENDFDFLTDLTALDNKKAA